MYNKKSGKFKSVAPKREVAKIPHRFDRRRAKICLNPIFLAYFNRDHEQGQICIHVCGFMGKT